MARSTTEAMRADDPLHLPDPHHDGGPLLQWYRSKRRDLPWRETSDPYAVWVSEAMLQQTQVSTVIPYWLRWMQAFPTVEHLAAADEQAVLSQWQGLGYYRRGRLLREGAAWVVANGMPTDAAGWLRVPGVGPYTAAAIASIAQGDPAPLVDGNVERVYARLTGDARSGPALRRAAWEWAGRQLFPARPGDWNQALMELGTTVCRPVAPACGDCPLEARCVARQTWRVDELPVRPPRKATVSVRHVTWIPVFGGRLGVRQIPDGAWWAGMWEFPRAVRGEDGEIEELRALVGPGWVQEVGAIRHSVTHHRIRLDICVVRADSASEALQWRTVEELAELPMPSPQRKALRVAMTIL